MFFLSSGLIIAKEVRGMDAVSEKLEMNYFCSSSSEVFFKTFGFVTRK